jgi:hypothetical protein
MDLPRRPFSLAAQDWLVPAPAKIVVTSADGESKEGGEEGRRTSEHLQEEETRILTRIDENKEARDRPTTGITIRHTRHHPQPDPRPTIGSPRRAQRPQRPQTAEFECTRNAVKSLIRPQGLLNTSPPSTDHQTDRRPRLVDQPHAAESTSHQISGCLPEKLLTRACQPARAYKRIHQTIYQPFTSHQTIYQPSTSHQTIYQTSTSHQISGCLPEKLLTRACQPTHAYKRIHQTIYQPSTSHQTIYQPSTSHQTICQPSTRHQTIYQPYTIYQPSTSHQPIYQPSDHLDHIPRRIQLYCCHKKGEKYLIQKLHGHYTSLKPNSFRSGDDWPD